MKHYSVSTLTNNDFLKLKQDPQPYTRAAIAKKIGVQLEAVPLDSSAYQLVVDIALFLQQDKHEQVRRTLAESVRHSEAAPKTLILKLANDSDDEVAVPVLRDSPLLEDEDITTLIQETEKQIRLIAVAERRFLSTAISASLIEKSYEGVCLALLSNETAKIDSQTYSRIAALYSRSSAVLQHMLKRIPLSDQAVIQMKKAQGTTGQNNQPVKANSAFSTLSSQELSNLLLTLMLLGETPDSTQYEELAHKLAQNRKINATSLIACLCLGQTELFYRCLSEVTGLPYEGLKEISQVEHPEKLNPVFIKAGVSSSLFPLMHWVWQGTMRKLEQGIKPAGKQFAKLMSIHLREGARRGVNFAATLGTPIANALDKLF